MVILGYEVELNNCVNCSCKITPKENFVSISLGGLICSKCAKTKDILTISDNSIKMLKLAINNDFEDIFKIKVDTKTKKELTNIICSFKEYSLS